MERPHNVVSLLSLGAAQTVTGSKHLLRTPELNILMDCGLFQGLKALRELNWQKLTVEASDIDVVLLSHAHLDHCGYLPLLVKNGFKGKIFLSAPTGELSRLILLDSAHIQEEDAARANKYGYSKHTPALPLYTEDDVATCLKHFRVIEANVETRLSNNISFLFKPCGHIPGACSILINCFGKKIVYSGDLGRQKSAILPSPEYFEEADLVIMESTYGDRLHTAENIIEGMASLINETLNRNGNVLIPSFAVGRAQELIYIITELKRQAKIPYNIPVYLDSPMAASATEILQRYPEWTSLSKTECTHIADEVIINTDYRNTAGIIGQRKSKIIIASSGMLSGGRVLEYLKQYISDSRNSILIIGFQAEGTRGRALLNKACEIKIHGKYYVPRAQVHEITGLSAHADQAELLSWLAAMKKKPEKVFLVHGEPSALEALRVKVTDSMKLPVVIVPMDREIILFRCNAENLEYSSLTADN